MLKREAREILALEDDPDLKLVSERTYDICELLLELHDRGELRDRLPAGQRARSPTTRPASSRATGSASRRSSCSR